MRTPHDATAAARDTSRHDDVQVRDNPVRSRFEILLGSSVVGHLRYSRHGNVLVAVHAEVDEAYGGRGLGSRLVGTALDLTRERGMRVEVQCPFVTAYIAKHPEYTDLVAVP